MSEHRFRINDNWNDIEYSVVESIFIHFYLRTETDCYRKVSPIVIVITLLKMRSSNMLHAWSSYEISYALVWTILNNSRPTRRWHVKRAHKKIERKGDWIWGPLAACCRNITNFRSHKTVGISWKAKKLSALQKEDWSELLICTYCILQQGSDHNF